MRPSVGAQPSQVSFSILSWLLFSIRQSFSSQSANLHLPSFDKAWLTAEFSKKVCVKGETGSVVAPLPACFPALFTVFITGAAGSAPRATLWSTRARSATSPEMSHQGQVLRSVHKPYFRANGKGKNPCNYCSVHLDVQSLTLFFFFFVRDRATGQWMKLFHAYRFAKWKSDAALMNLYLCS